MELKRKSTPEFDENQAKKLQLSCNKSRLAWDKYCFACHKVASNLFCGNCCRSYHITCIRNKPQVLGADRFSCEYCTEAIRGSISSCRTFKANELTDALKYIMPRLYKNFNKLELLNANSANTKTTEKILINPIDLDTINAKVIGREYQTLVGFLSDIHWLQHNYRITQNVDDAHCRILKQFISLCEKELHDIDICIECYCNANEHPNDWFTMLCEHPHILVWAKCDDDYWPAKAMAMTTISNENRIYVQYFGGSRRCAYVEPTECFLYSTIHPNGIQFHQIDDQHKAADQDLNKYRENIIERFGLFRYAGERVFLKPQRVIYQLKAMIPELDLVSKSIDRFFNASPFQMVLPCAVEQADATQFWNMPMFQPTVLLNVMDAPPSITPVANQNNVKIVTDVNMEEVIPSPPFEVVPRKTQPKVGCTTVIFGNGEMRNIQHMEIIDISDEERNLIENLASNNVEITQVKKVKPTKRQSKANRNTRKGKKYGRPERNAIANGTVVIDDSESNGMHKIESVKNSLEVPSVTAKTIACASNQQVAEIDNNNNEDFANFNATGADCIPADDDCSNIPNAPIDNTGRHSVLSELNMRFKAYDQEITNRDKMIRTKDLEIAVLKKKINMVEIDLKSMITCVNQVKSIHKTLVESCERLGKEKNARNQTYDASNRHHNQTVATAKAQHQAALEQLVNDLRRK